MAETSASRPRCSKPLTSCAGRPAQNRSSCNESATPSRTGHHARSRRIHKKPNRKPLDSIDITTSILTADANVKAVAGTDNTGAGRAKIDGTATTAAIATVIDNIDKTIDTVTSERATLGATQNRFE